MIPRASVVSAAFLAALFAAPAFGQTVPVSQPPVPEPVATSTPEGGEDIQGDGIDRVSERAVRRSIGQTAQPIVSKDRPGAALLRTFDTNRDGRISAAELAVGAQAAFKAADTNQDGLVSGLEQTAWAANYGGKDDVLSNSMLFDADLNRMVTEQEFISGVQRLAEPARDSSGVVPVSNLTIAARPEDQPLPPLQERPRDDRRGQVSGIGR